MRMIFENKPMLQPIERQQVWEAYKEVRKHGESPGVDGVPFEMVNANPRKYLYPLWRRMASGSYFPKPVRESEIPKQDGSKRVLGIPTVCDRVAQMDIKQELEAEIDKYFSVNSYGYRPNLSAHDAIEQCRINCMKYSWVIDLDIRGFFDNIDHRLMIRALKKFTTKRHILLYVKRWLKAPIQKPDGCIVEKQSKGTPQGGVISPLLANIFLHFAFDTWFEENFPELAYERYADDIVVHCRQFGQAKDVLRAIEQRFKQCLLELHPEKTRIVYCKRNQKNRPPWQVKYIKFTFLGYTFQPRWRKSDKGKYLLGFTPAISDKAIKRILEVLRDMKIHRWVSFDIQEVAHRLAARLRGWINYFGRFNLSAMRRVFRLLNMRLLKWVRNKYKRFRRKPRHLAWEWLRNVCKSFPNLFVHWQYGFRP
jgi:RNA-directed DNA polymerase